MPHRDLSAAQCREAASVMPYVRHGKVRICTMVRGANVALQVCDLAHGYGRHLGLAFQVWDALVEGRYSTLCTQQSTQLQRLRGA